MLLRKLNIAPSRSTRSLLCRNLSILSSTSRTNPTSNTSSSFNTTLTSLPPTSSLVSRSSNFSTLPELLQREINEENDNPLNEMPTDLAELKSKLSESWTIVDGASVGSSDGATVKMYRKNNLDNGSKVTITFHCQDSLDPNDLGFLQGAAEEAMDALNASGNPDDDQEEEDSVPIKFDVMVSKAGKIMHLSCMSQDAEATIDGITISTSEEDLENEDLYRGPMLEDLPEDLRDSMDEFLQNEIGVDEDVAAFIAMYADHREQMEYITWLKDVKIIVD